MNRGHVLAVLFLLGAVACAGDPAQPVAGGTPDPFEGMPICQPPDPADIIDRHVPGLTLPEGAVITDISQEGPMTTVTGYVELTPLQIADQYEGRPGVLGNEHEVVESETLLSQDGHRAYVKANAVCNPGSILIAIVTPEPNAGVPMPADSSPRSSTEREFR